MLVRRKKIYRKREFLPAVAVKVSGISRITNKRLSAKRNTRHSGFFKTAKKIVEAATHNGARVAGPIPLPTSKEVVTILRAVHKYKDSREQFELRTHKRLIDVIRPSAKAIEALQTLELPAGVEISMDS